MAVQIQIRNDTAANWSSANPVLMVGEMGVDTTNDQFRIGDGSTNWDDLPVAGVTAGGTLDGNIDFDGYKAINAVIEDYTETLTTSSGTGDVTLDLENGNVFEHTVDADITTTFKVANVRAQTHSLTLIIHQHTDGPSIVFDFDDGNGGGDILWAYDEIPEIDDDETNILVFWTLDEGATWYGQLVGSEYGEGT